jgi:hypothetical protein
MLWLRESLVGCVWNRDPPKWQLTEKMMTIPMDFGVQPNFWTHPYWISLSRIGSTPCLASLTLEVKPCETIDLFFWHQVPVFLIIVPFNLPFTWGTFQTNPIFGGSHGTMGGWVTSPSCFRQGCVEANILKRLNSLFDSDDTLGRRVGWLWRLWIGQDG